MKQFSSSYCFHKRVFKAFALLFLIAFLGAVSFLGSACGNKINYFDYVSELRSNIFLASDENFALRVYSVKREIPYTADGVCGETATLTEVRLSAGSGESDCKIEFTVNGKKYGGDASYDNVKSEYSYSCSLDSASAREIPFTITFGDTVYELTAKTVLTENTLTPKNILNAVKTSEGTLFKNMTDKYGFKGEIYLRLIYEDAPYYYLGIVSREKKTVAFLLNAETGKILAKRES
ncbi:MAG: hypothetical protein IJ506_06320 [Clostridia bacterium]|nr:hypothetical protein [Clostridia bacterium]